MGSKSKIVRKTKPSSHFAPSNPEVTFAKCQPGTQFASMDYSEHNSGVPAWAHLTPGSYRVEQWSEGDPKKVETVYTAFKHTSGPFEGELIPRDITVKREGEVLSFTAVTDEVRYTFGEYGELTGMSL